MRCFKLIISHLLLVLVFTFGCSSRKEVGEERLAELQRKELGIERITKWNGDVVNQIQIFDREGRKIREQWLNPNGVIVTQRVINYNPEGLRGEVIWYKGDSILKSRNLFEYDRRGRLAEELWLTPEDQQQNRSEYIYTKDRLEEIRRYDTRDNYFSSFVYLYENDLLVEHHEKDRSGNLLNRQVYEHNDDGHKVNEEWFDRRGNRTARRVFQYNSDGLLEETVEFRDGEFRHRQVTEYDENNLIRSEKWFDEAGNVTFENTYTYDYFE